jgi:hypothetical protein
MRYSWLVRMEITNADVQICWIYLLFPDLVAQKYELATKLGAIYHP